MNFHNIAILQPLVPHYRTEFFKLLDDKVNLLDIYVYYSYDQVLKQGFSIDEIKLYKIYNLEFKGVLWYNPFKLLQKKYDTIVLMWHFAHITTWLLLLTKFIHRKKIIVWGHGISVKRYLMEEKKPNFLLKLMLFLSDGAWVYMPKEAKEWQKIFPNKDIVALNNTLSGVKDIVGYKPLHNKDELRKKYKIKEKRILLFCARFNNPFRRIDLLIETIEKLKKDTFGFVIIGDGIYKPNFTQYCNVYDFGAVYDVNIKRDLFTLSDLYFQPGWVGLSIVEAMAYGKPICTFIRNEETLHCVEYSYIVEKENGLIFKDINDCIDKLNSINIDDIMTMGNNAKKLVKEKLSICNMVENAISIL